MMQETLKRWLNSRRDYFHGVAIYEQFNPDEKLLAVLNSGPNEFRQKRLVEELMKIYQKSTSKENERIFTGAPGVSGVAAKTEKQKSNTTAAQTSQSATANATANANIITQNANKITQDAKPDTLGRTPERNETGPIENGDQQQTAVHPCNPVLYNACKEEADNEYKKVMNTRAVLLKKAAPDGFLDINKPDLIFDRGELAIQIVQGWQKVSELYDRADYVKQHGRLPSAVADLEDDNQYDLIPDSLVKQRLDNARKAYNKLKKKPSTPDRVALLQQHEENIQKLQAKWDSLRPKQ